MAIYQPHTCGSLFCPYCSRKKRLKVLLPYKEVLASLARKQGAVFYTLTIRNGKDIVERVEIAFKALTRLYEIRPFRPKVWKKLKEEFRQELKAYAEYLKRLVRAGVITRKEAKRKIETQVKYFKQFVKKYKSLPNAKELKLGQILPVIWVFELTKGEGGYHPHWHGIGLERLPKLLLTVLWRKVTKGEGQIVDVRTVNKGKRAEQAVMDYLMDYVADGFVAVGDNTGGPDFTEMVEIETALYGRRKVRVWGFDLIKGQQFGQKLSIRWKSLYRLKMHFAKEEKAKNIADYYKVRREARKKNRAIGYRLVEFEERNWAEFYFGMRAVFVVEITPNGLMRLRPVGLSKEDWEAFLFFAYEIAEIEGVGAVGWWRLSEGFDSQTI